MIRAQILRHLSGIGGLIVTFVFKADGKSFHRFRRIFLGDSSHQRRIVAAAQKASQRHIGNHPGSHRLLKKPFQLRLSFPEIRHRIFLHFMVNVSNVPIFPGLYFPLMKPQDFSRLQLIYILKNTVRRVDILLVKEAGQHIPAYFLRKSGAFHDRLQFRSEYQVFSVQPIGKGLFSNPIPYKKDFLGTFIIKGQGKHTVKPVNTGNTPFQISCDNDFRITVRLKGVVGKFFFQFFKIIYFTVINNTNPILRGAKGSVRMHGLMAQHGKIHDGKSPLCKPNPIAVFPGINFFPGVVGPTVVHRVIHDLQSLIRNLPPAHKTTNTAHTATLLSFFLLSAPPGGVLSYSRSLTLAKCLHSLSIVSISSSFLSCIRVLKFSRLSYPFFVHE
jgi:hypothetical protein